MDMLRNFGKPNSVIRIISIFSAIFLAIVQFFGMGYKLNIDAWIVSKTEKLVQLNSYIDWFSNQEMCRNMV